MAFETKDKKQKFGNRMKANRYDRAHQDEKPEKMGGPRAQAHEVEAQKPMGEEQAEEQVHPGIHEEIKGIAAEHGPAHEVHMAHDHAAQVSHVHSVHEDGHQHHAQHEGEGHVMNAHHHAMHAAGITPEEGEENKEGEYPEEHKSATADGQEDDYEPEGL